MDSFWEQIGHLIWTFADPRNLQHPERYIAALSQGGVMWSAVVAVNLIVFTETGLLIGFLLPGDSMLVVTGIVAYSAQWPIEIITMTLCVSAVVGDTVGYAIGAKTGSAIFNRPQSRFFKRDHLLAAKAYYERHGGKTIIIARFIPLIRTFVPVVAGAAKMEYRSFLAFNVFGGVGWIVSMLMIGYYLDHFFRRLLDQFPWLCDYLGHDFSIAKHIDKVVIIVVFLSILPILTKAFRHWRKKKAAKAQ